MLLSYSFRTMLKKHLIISTVVTAVVLGMIALFAAVFQNVEKDGSELSNVSTPVLMIIGFLWTFHIGYKNYSLSLCFNCSRRSAIKSVYAVMLVNVLYTSTLIIASEFAISAISDHFGFNYQFRPLVDLFRIEEYNGAEDLLLAFGFQLLFCYFVFVVAVLVMALALRIGKWAWMGFWVFYMLVFFAGSNLVNGLESAADKICITLGIDKGFGLVVFLVLLSGLLTWLSVKLFKKTELNRSFLGGIAKTA